jgi:hypothetical protein
MKPLFLTPVVRARAIWGQDEKESETYLNPGHLSVVGIDRQAGHQVEFNDAGNLGWDQAHLHRRVATNQYDVRWLTNRYIALADAAFRTAQICRKALHNCLAWNATGTDPARPIYLNPLPDIQHVVRIYRQTIHFSYLSPTTILRYLGDVCRTVGLRQHVSGFTSPPATLKHSWFR